MDAPVRRRGRRRDTRRGGSGRSIAEKPGGHPQRDRALLRHRRGRRTDRTAQARILIAVDLIDAAKSGDTAKFEAEDKRWSANAEEIADFLSGANPHWRKDDVLDLLNLRLALTKRESVARLERNWSDDVAAFDEIFTESLTLSDALSEGVLKQFPEKFAA